MRDASALLLDLDGTLTDNYRGIAGSIVSALERLGVAAPDEATLRRCVGPPLRESFRWLLGTEDRALIERAIGFYRERFSTLGWRENVVYDGIPACLERLRAGPARLFVCTAKPEAFATRIIEHFGFGPHFARVYGADLAGRFDDKATLLAHLLATEGIAPGSAVMIGDRDNDLRAARANGVRAVGVLWGYGSREELAGADALVAVPSELPPLFLGK